MELSAIGIIEVSFYTNAVILLDTMLKAADVKLVSCRKTLGGRMVTLVVAGSVSSVEAAINSAIQIGEEIGSSNIKIAITISKPHEQVVKFLELL